MLTESKIESIFKAEGISVYKTNYTLDFDTDIIFESDDIGTFVQFVKENDVKSVFYALDEIEKDDFLITEYDMPDIDEMLSFRAYPIEIEEQVSNAFLSHFKLKQTEFNKKIDKKVLEGPAAVHIYCMFNGTSIGFLDVDEHKLNLPDKEEVLQEIKYVLENLVNDQMAQERKKKNQKADEMLQLACQHLDESDDWHSCTNQRLRRAYCKQLMERFEKEYGAEPSLFDLQNELEIRWNQYKANKKVSK